ncbi:DEKNAAC102847 [Brettanomyces naardenensis]|uniref:DEKNAAC102847 n=1 Tax=Brettanomyces naardenensis TaxID=13370 RepID=A0A448YLR1_BRENA|nr:DEKNAAC102847 [Brettanomyces naardenensis]
MDQIAGSGRSAQGGGQSNGFFSSNGSNDPPQQQQKDYTLPGIMQYLQSQFTLAEKNRMQNDLEKSSLKLKIVELESERNSLKLQNEKLNLRVQQLEDQIVRNGAGEGSSDDAGNGLFKSIAKGKKHVVGKQHTEEDDFERQVAEINTIDVKKLIKARQFLKSATSEIMYLLKSPSVESEDPLHLGKDSYFMNPERQQRQQQEDSDIVKRVGKANDDFVDMEIPLEDSPMKPKRAVLFQDREPGSDSETSTVIDTAEDLSGDESGGPISPFPKRGLKLLKRSEQSSINYSTVKMKHPPELGKLIGGTLFCYEKETNSLKSYGNIAENNAEVNGVYHCPSGFVDVIDIKCNGRYVVVAGKNEVLIYTIAQSLEGVKPLVVYSEIDSDLKSVDLDRENNNLVLSFGSIVEVLHIEDQTRSLLPVFTTNYHDKGELLGAKFVEFSNSFDIAILTTTSLVLQAIGLHALVRKNQSDGGDSMQVINLSSFDHFLLTSRSLIINLAQGLFLIDYSSLTSFNHVPMKAQLEEDAYLGACEDDSSIFYARVSTDTIDLFKSIETGDIFNIKALTGLSATSLWCCVGTLDNCFAVCLGDTNGVVIHRI